MGILGNPNVGKTTFGAKAYEMLQLYGVTASHLFDLDSYSPSVEAALGKIAWDERVKKNEISAKEFISSIEEFLSLKGLVIADFPGQIEDKFQVHRILTLDLGFVLANNANDRTSWLWVLKSLGKPFVWLQSRIVADLSNPIDPFITNLNRNAYQFDVRILIILTRIIEHIAYQTGMELTDIDAFFTQAERIVLHEFLDFFYAPLPEVCEDLKLLF